MLVSRGESDEENVKDKNDVDFDDNLKSLILGALKNLKGVPLHYCLSTADPSQLDSLFVSGKPLLHVAIRQNVSAVPILLLSGCDVNIPDTVHGDTALHVACFYCDFPTVTQLVQHGADINIHNVYGQTPLDKLLTGCSKPSKCTSTRLRLMYAHTLARVGFKINPGAKGHHLTRRHKIVRTFKTIKRCDECPSLQHLCRLRTREQLQTSDLQGAVTSLEIAPSLKEYLLFRPYLMDRDVICKHFKRLEVFHSSSIS